MAFSDQFLQELAERNEIEDVVSGYVKLTKRSGQNVFGLCPFHSEKSPSFSVSPSRQIYHCFGCGKGGSVINFIMEIENISFPDAVEFLARRAGMTIPEQDNDPGRPKRERLYNLNRDAARYFFDELVAPSGAAAQSYLQQRGLSSSISRRFGLGFAPDGWDGLTNAMKRLGYSERELADAGLVRSGKKGGVYDTFRNRLMFPVIDVRGNVIGFSGRGLGGVEPKYMNSPETPVFSKSHNLFGLNLAKKSKAGYIILVEGNIDVVSLHQAGFDSTVASLGTSLTPEQARLLSRYAKDIVICYDADSAGIKASQRAIGILEKLEIKVRVLTLTGANDPDDYIKANGADAFRNLLDKSENHVDYRLQTVLNKHDLTTDDGKVLFLREATDMVASLAGAVEREVYAMRVASLCGVSDVAVKTEVARRRKRKTKAATKQSERDLFRPARSAQPSVKAIRYSNPRSASAEEGVIRLLSLDPTLFRDPASPGEGDFSSKELYHIFSELRSRTKSGEPISPAAMGAALSPDEMSLMSSILQKPESTANGRRALEDYIEIMKAENGVAVSCQEDLRTIADRLKEKKGYKG